MLERGRRGAKRSRENRASRRPSAPGGRAIRLWRRGLPAGGERRASRGASPASRGGTLASGGRRLAPGGGCPTPEADGSPRKASLPPPEAGFPPPEASPDPGRRAPRLGRRTPRPGRPETRLPGRASDGPVTAHHGRGWRADRRGAPRPRSSGSLTTEGPFSAGFGHPRGRICGRPCPKGGGHGRRLFLDHVLHQEGHGVLSPLNFLQVPANTPQRLGCRFAR